MSRPSVLLIALLLLSACSGVPAGSETRSSVAPPDPTPLSTTRPTSPASTATTTPTSAPSAPPPELEGQIAYVAGAGDPQVHLLDLATGESRQLTDLRPEDGEPLAAGPMRPAISCGFGPSGLAWSPDGSRLAFNYGGCETVLWLVDLDGNQRRLGDGRGPAWSPDGALIAFAPNRPFAPCGAGCTGDPPSPGAWDLHVIEVDGGAARPLGSDGATLAGGSPSYSPDGALIAFSGPLPEPANDPEQFQATYVADSDGANRRLIARGAWPFGWLPDGRLIVIEESHGSARAVDLQTADTELLAGGATVEAVSPDGSRLLGYRFHPVTGATQSLLLDLDGSVLAEMSGYAVDWAPDGKAFMVVDFDVGTIAIHAFDGPVIASFAVEAGGVDIRARWRPAR